MRADRLLAASALILTTSAACSASSSTAAPPPRALTGPAAGNPVPASSPLAAYAFPTSIDPSARYLFYLHGKIVEDQGLAALDPVFGAYEYQAILEHLGSTGLIVISEQRGKDADGTAYAARLGDQVARLEEAGVAPQHITVVGASKGAAIAALASFMIQDPLLNFVLLGTCYPGMSSEWQSSGMHLYGNVLSIRDVADVDYAGSCEDLYKLSEGRGLGRHSELVLQLGTGHGILYHPLDEWILPTLAWAGG